MNGEIPSPLFILEMANNHMGSVDHGLRIINEAAESLRGLPYRVAIKFQYRDMDTFIHPAYRARFDVKHIKRFIETRLTEADFRRLKSAAEEHSFLTACTPFDERSVDRIGTQGFDILKIASCSFTDWPLLEKIATMPLPIVASTAGADLDDIDKVVSFFVHRNRKLALMHCVGLYPTPDAGLQLNQIDLLRNRYPGIRIGFSTHEVPVAVDPIRLAVAKGASIFEKHLAVPTNEYSANAYSATPREIRTWVEAAASALTMCGVDGERVRSDGEQRSLSELRRGAYATDVIQKGDTIKAARVFFAMPTQQAQLTASDFSKYADIKALATIGQGEPLMQGAVQLVDHRERVYEIAESVKGLLRTSGVSVPKRADLEISHHYGFERFADTGLTMITVVNREYCKKLIVLLPGQHHPEQYHKQKEETFHVLYGDLRLWLDGKEQRCLPGEVVRIDRNIRHAFSTEAGVVIEELSSTHVTSDSYYTDSAIERNTDRKTFLTYWLD